MKIVPAKINGEDQIRIPLATKIRPIRGPGSNWWFQIKSSLNFPGDKMYVRRWVKITSNPYVIFVRKYCGIKS